MILNAFQLERSKDQIGSIGLQKSFIEKTQLKINEIDHSPLLSINKIIFWKKLTFLSLTISFLSISPISP